MSILPISPASIGVNLFSMGGVSVRDIGIATVDGEDVESLVDNRTIEGAVDARRKKIQFIFGSIVSDGDIAIFTHDSLFIADIYESGEVPKQSYITYGNKEYKVIEIGDWSEQVGVNVYLAQRHVQQQGL